jgi:phosphoribosylamine--glycine ligase
MHILLIGNGGREHAIAWKLALSPQVTKISVAPGSDGIAGEAKVHKLDISLDDHAALSEFASNEGVQLTVVGPEVPLVAGIVDHFEQAGLRILGPSKAAAQLEGSKAFAKEFMQRHGIPSSSHATFSDADAAHAYLDEKGAPIVIKADGLAAGKGVVVAQTLDEAHAAVSAMLADQSFGSAGSTVVIEDFLRGEEASFIALVDGKHCLPFASSQDHKARDDGDRGPNTGGMGAYSPAPVVTDTVEAHVMKDIVEPTVAGMIEDGTPFKGFLYVGLMINEKGEANVVEYNVRLGDPETQPLLMRLDSDLLTLLDATVNGELHNTTAQWKSDAAIGVVLAGGDYPHSSSSGEVITGIEAAEAIGCKVFHAGTVHKDEQWQTNGGRVLCVTATGATIKDAKASADVGASQINWQHMHYRRDIAHRAVARLEA